MSQHIVQGTTGSSIVGKSFGRVEVEKEHGLCMYAVVYLEISKV